MTLTPRQIKTLSDRRAVIIKPTQVRDDGEHELQLRAVKHKKLMKNMGKSKGYRLALDETEGGSFIQRAARHLSTHKDPEDITKSVRRLVGKKPRVSRMPVIVSPQQPTIQGMGIELPLTKENLIRASEPFTNIGPIYFDESRFIRPNQPAWTRPVLTSIVPVGNWT